MGLTHLTVILKSFTSLKSFESEFLVETGATDSLAPAAELKNIGINVIGKMAYELANGSIVEYEYDRDETTAGQVIFGPDDVEPILGVTALESAGIMDDPANRTLKRLPAIPLK